MGSYWHKMHLHTFICILIYINSFSNAKLIIFLIHIYTYLYTSTGINKQADEYVYRHTYMLPVVVIANLIVFVLPPPSI